ncbi:hypothetical protein QZM26_00030 [Burkholderia multivorans]|uniref:hypothetical protein n=1 Tax=Burkholderia multivorans TaxID=87883 RepID=UPI001C2318E5|nr:hypothetical protein [Burkholderia multivorans]MBU9446899.1 hypothetical protein [Burkholderia multivorans]MDN7867794.1 hypothetical protein [Burkholderia multivorans]MDR8750745.1 hypothetical protein [Burkholderia multivorans]MDR8809698.1 hypothetical protein [Burkholderia multivorans]
MNEINDGGPAFPSGVVRKSRQRPHDAGSNFIVTDMTEPRNPGLSLRDYFAAKAMGAMLMHDVNGDWPEHKNVAKHAYDMADEMLRARGEA